MLERPLLHPFSFLLVPTFAELQLLPLHRSLSSSPSSTPSIHLESLFEASLPASPISLLTKCLPASHPRLPPSWELPPVRPSALPCAPASRPSLLSAASPVRFHSFLRLTSASPWSIGVSMEMSNEVVVDAELHSGIGCESLKLLKNPSQPHLISHWTSNAPLCIHLSGQWAFPAPRCTVLMHDGPSLTLFSVQLPLAPTPSPPP